jgi:hypothetical protein
MALKQLSIEEMEQVSAAWVDTSNPANSIFSGVVAISGLLPQVQQVHDELHAAVPQDNPAAKELAALASETDYLHDVLARGIYGYLTEVALLVDNGAALLELRNSLMPEGLGKVVRNTYRGQAGFAALLRQRLDASARSQLEALPLPNDDNLLNRVQAWLDAGDRLGKLEERKARLEAASPTTAGMIQDARNRWIRVANAVIANADLAELDDAQQRTLLGPLRDAEAKADLRQARKKAGEVPAEDVVTPPAS